MIDMVLGEDLLSKFSVTLDDSNPLDLVYTLTINYVDETDLGSMYCIADVVGYPEYTWPKDSVYLWIESMFEYI